MLEGLVVADDLTGACDTGHEFAARGWQTRVALTAPGEPGDADVLVVDADSRYANPEAAAESVAAAIDAHPAAVVYKKVDSTLRGNVVAEVDAALRGVSDRNAPADTASTLAIVAPATPATGRTTACGYHLVDGKLVTDTEAGRDPDRPPADPHVPTLFEPSVHPVEAMGIDPVAMGADAIADRLDRIDDRRIVVADATHEAHLGSIADAARRADVHPVYVGSAGLAAHVRVGSSDSDDTSPPERTRGPVGVTPDPAPGARGVLGIVGSPAPATLVALEAVPDTVTVALDVEEVIEDPDAAVRKAARQVRDVIDREGRGLVTAARDRTAVDTALAAGESAGLAPTEVRDRITRALGGIARTIVGEVPPRGLILTGGMTARSVLGSLDARSIALCGDAVESGIPVGVVEGGAAAGTAVVTKAGAFGDRETLLACLAMMNEV